MKKRLAYATKTTAIFITVLGGGAGCIYLLVELLDTLGAVIGAGPAYLLLVFSMIFTMTFILGPTPGTDE